MYLLLLDFNFRIILSLYDCAGKKNRQQMTSNLSGVQQLLGNLKKSLTKVLVKFKFLKSIKAK
jgi:hypothetical protein